jgi:hypothetical protein
METKEKRRKIIFWMKKFNCSRCSNEANRKTFEVEKQNMWPL